MWLNISHGLADICEEFLGNCYAQFVMDCAVMGPYLDTTVPYVGLHVWFLAFLYPPSATLIWVSFVKYQPWRIYVENFWKTDMPDLLWIAAPGDHTRIWQCHMLADMSYCWLSSINNNDLGFELE